MIEIDAPTLRDFEERFSALPEIAEQAARLAVNDAARYARVRISKNIREKLNFKRSDLTEKGGKLAVRKFATQGDLEALVSGQERPTSLARFRAGPVRFGRSKRRRGVPVKVLAGKTTQIKRGFYLKLRRGNSIGGDNFNVGLAVRLKKGERLTNSVGAVDIGKGVYLLYGPAIDQVFESYSNDELEAFGEKLQNEFDRQYERLSNERQ